ncbi:MAG: GNAT family N-acetyltransferase, partial [Bacteroidales bacterium]|nr:GNAT family N-acetyltransferase [Bacteroidales bacterium]
DVEGKVYADSLTEPKSFYILHSYGMSLLFGAENNNTFNEKLCNYLLNKEKKRTMSEWLQMHPYSWNTKLEQLIGADILKKKDLNTFIDGTSTSKKIIENTRVNFKFIKDRYQLFRDKIDLASYKIVRTDIDLYHQMDGSVVPKSFWKNAEQFDKQGVGFSLLFENKLASTAYSAFIHGKQLEIGIETSQEFQGRGLAAVACSAIIDYCLTSNMEPVWSCRLENMASFKLAQKLGFEPVEYRPYYEIRL